MKELTYICVGDYYIPNLKLAEQPDRSIGKYKQTLGKAYCHWHDRFRSDLLYGDWLPADGAFQRAYQCNFRPSC